jgi:hypothetical protein
MSASASRTTRRETSARSMLSLVSARISLPIIEPLRPSKPCVLPSWQPPFKELILIYGRIILYSETLTILAGMEEKQSFNVHKDLLAVHSTYFSNLLSEKGLGADEKISIPANASLFADFISWVYFGEFLKVENDALEGEQAVDDLWSSHVTSKLPHSRTSAWMTAEPIARRRKQIRRVHRGRSLRASRRCILSHRGGRSFESWPLIHCHTRILCMRTREEVLFGKSGRHCLLDRIRGKHGSMT